MRPIVALDLMTPEVLGISATWSIREAAQYLVDHEISGAVVRDDRGQITGVVSLTDIAAAAADAGTRIGLDRSQPDFYMRGWVEQLDPADLSRIRLTESARTVGDVMTREVYTVDANATVPEIASTMLESHIHRVLVQSGDELVGVISTSDLLGLLVQD